MCVSIYMCVYICACIHVYPQRLISVLFIVKCIYTITSSLFNCFQCLLINILCGVFFFESCRKREQIREMVLSSVCHLQLLCKKFYRSQIEGIPSTGGRSNGLGEEAPAEYQNSLEDTRSFPHLQSSTTSGSNAPSV